jgi:carbamoyl-phosphate synthase small subunit
MTNTIDRPRGKLVLADGTCYAGFLTGCSASGAVNTIGSGRGRLPVWGEVVFNTSMTGYQEVVTDPSYAGQIVVMTYPQIGNYGVNPDDHERSACAARALVVRELSPFFSPGPGRVSLEAFMAESGLPGLTGIDTRAVTRRIRSQGAVTAAIGGVEHSDEELLELARSHSFSRGESLVASVSGSLNGAIEGSNGGRAAVIDLGTKQSILGEICSLGLTVEVLDVGFNADEILAGGFDFVVLSNGPGDPEDVPHVVEGVRRIVGRVPVLGICLGHQVTALALGGRTYKLKFGHHGANQPVLERRTGRVSITSQNHGYAVADDIEERTGASITFTNANDGTLEGFAHDRLMVECVQFHPEASPGPHDTSYLFRDFFDKTKGWRHAAHV